MAVTIIPIVGEELEYIRKRLGDLQKKAPMVLRTAINKTAKEAKKQDERLTKRMYTAKGDIHALKFEKASTGNLTAILRDKGSNISISHFSHYAGKRGISAIINTTHGRRQIGKYGNKAFFTGGLLNGGSTILVRKTAARLPLEKMASISSPVMHGNDQTWGTMENEVRQKLHENVEKEIERILGQ